MNRKKASKMINILMENGINSPEDLIKILEEEEMAKKNKGLNRDGWKEIIKSKSTEAKVEETKTEDNVVEDTVETTTTEEVKEEIKETVKEEEKVVTKPKRNSNIKNKIMASYEAYVKEVKSKRESEELLEKNILIVSKFMLRNMSNKLISMDAINLTKDLSVKSNFAEIAKEKGGVKCHKIIGVMDVFKGDKRVISFANFNGKLVELTKSTTNLSSRAPLEMSCLAVKDPGMYMRDLVARFK